MHEIWRHSLCLTNVTEVIVCSRLLCLSAGTLGPAKWTVLMNRPGLLQVSSHLPASYSVQMLAKGCNNSRGCALHIQRRGGHCSCCSGPSRRRPCRKRKDVPRQKRW